MVKVKMFLCACLCVLAALPAVAKGDFIEVRNTDPNNNHMLSDLIVYGDPNDPNQVKWILIPGSEFSFDDVNIPPKGRCMYYADFKITRYIVSEGYWAHWDTTYFYDEGETSVFKVNVVKPKKVGMILDPDQQQTVVLAIDQTVAPEPPPEGTILAFVEGYNELMPGWFVGTGINYDTGEVTGAYTGIVEVFSTAFEVTILPSDIRTQWNIDFQGDGNHNNTYGQTDPVDYTEWGVYWNIFEVPALSAPWPGPTNYVTNPSMDLADSEGNVGVGKSSLVKFSIVGDAYGWAGDAGDDPLTGDYLIILNSFGVTNDPLTWRITGLAPSTTYRLTYYHRANVLGRGINFVANGVETTVSVPGLSVASALVTTGWGRIITGTADSDGYAEGNWSALTISTVADTATNPHPANGATDVPLDVVLGWTPGDYAMSHDVYFGTDRDAVANANPGSPEYKGRLAANGYDPGGLEPGPTYHWYDPGGLEPGTTYYWKVDEVEADGATTGGEVWSFTTIGGSTKASNPYPADGATDVALDAVVRWTPYLGAVSHDVYFGTSSPPAFIGNLAASSYDPGTLEPGTTYYWKVDEVEADGATTGGEVWSFTTIGGSTKASNPYPADGATDVPTDVVVSWKPIDCLLDDLGYAICIHDVYFGTDFDAVANADTSDTTGIYRGRQDANSYDPGGLEVCRTYYWRTDEVVPTVGEIWRVARGEIWSFTTACLTPFIVDDFEGYDYFTNRISQTWKDGYGYGDLELGYSGNGTGSRVDIDLVTVHEGAQSMKFDYDNTGTFRDLFGLPVNAYYSQAGRTFDVPQDWTAEGVEVLSLWFYEEPNNIEEYVFVCISDGTNELIMSECECLHDDIGYDCVIGWQEWNIDLREFSDAGVDLTNIKKIYIGVGDRADSQPGGTGTLYFDDIRLCPPR